MGFEVNPITLNLSVHGDTWVAQIGQILALANTIHGQLISVQAQLAALAAGGASAADLAAIKTIQAKVDALEKTKP